MTTASAPRRDSARISTSPLKALKIGAPWKQSPLSTHTTFSLRARSRLMSVAMRARPPICTSGSPADKMGDSGA